MKTSEAHSEKIKMNTYYDPKTGNIVRKLLDFSNLTLNNQKLSVVYVNSKIILKNKDPAFSKIIQDLEKAPYPGFYLTPLQKGDKEVRVRFHLNRHCILQSELFKDSSGVLYRDIDAKGIGYSRSFPIIVVPTCVSELEGDFEVRGILHNDIAKLDAYHSEEMYKLGIRVARHIAHIELFGLVDENGNIIPRQDLGEKICANLELIRPTIAIRAQGTTSRIWDLFKEYETDDETNKTTYVREILEDAREFISKEFSHLFTPEEYIAWFYETFATQLATLHKNNILTDFTQQIHMGEHNVTLDCRLTDTARYGRPMKGAPRKEIKSYEEQDISYSKGILSTLSKSVQRIYNITDDLENRLTPLFDKTYKNIR